MREGTAGAPLITSVPTHTVVVRDDSDRRRPHLLSYSIEALIVLERISVDLSAVAE